jgi:asparagine synthase (glutamine-hydrolysing)
MTKDHVKVVLTGDAGDENFAGYPRYLRSKWVSLFTKIPERGRKDILPKLIRLFSLLHWKEETLNRLADFIERLSKDQARNYLEQVKYFNGKEKEDLYTDGFADRVKDIDPVNFLVGKFEEISTDDLLDRLLYVDINTYLPEDLLVKVDIATMANSLEARIPFLDHQFMELTATIPSHLKLRGRENKFILKKAFADLLPDEVLNRKKMGFGVPLSRWFRHELKDYAQDILLDKRTLDRGYFRKEGIAHLLDEHIGMHYDHSARIWALLILELWFRTFMDKEGYFASNDA